MAHAIMAGKIIIFHRAEGWYPTEYPQAYSDWQAEADRNPGTLKIEDAHSGKILWCSPTAPASNPTGEE